LSAGAVAGNTPYWNGTSWVVNSSNIFNNGGNIGIGTATPSATLEVNGQVKITGGSPGTGKVLTSDANGLATWVTPSSTGSGWSITGNSGTVDTVNFIGTTDNKPFNIRVNNQKAARIDSTRQNSFFGYQSGNAGFYNDTVAAGIQNTAIGFQSLYLNESGTTNTASGYKALNANTTGNGNTANGGLALNGNTTGAYNTALGLRSMELSGSGDYNTGVGQLSLYNNNSGDENTAIGASSLLNSNSGSFNTAIGKGSLQTNTTGSSNTAIGYNADVATGALSNATAIGANAVVSASNSLVLGSGANVGIGTSSPANKLHIVGTVRIVDGSQGAGKVLTSDVNGVASWVTPAGASGWNITGNAGTVDGTNFIGTTDSQPFNIKVDNQKAGRISTSEESGTFFGYQAGNVNAGTSNAAFGHQALLSTTTGSSNTAVGTSALFSNVGGSSNTAMGYQTLYSCSTGTSNAAFGAQTLQLNTTGSFNTAIGNEALFSNTTANNNTAVGYQTIYTCSTGTGNSALGTQALQNTLGNYNVASGYHALRNNTTGNSNSAFGVQALYTNTTGNRNTAIGDSALYSPSTANNGVAVGYRSQQYANNTITSWDNTNTSVGYQSLRGSLTAANNTGTGNTAIGRDVMFNNTSGSRNTAMGDSALRANTTGINNTAIGYVALLNNTTGLRNTALGDSALLINTTGSGNTALGTNATAGANNLSNATVLGADASVSASNKVRLGNASVTVVEGQVAYTSPSDARFKENINEDEVQGLEFITKLRPIAYNFNRLSFAKHIGENTEGREQELQQLSQSRSAGFLAQEVESAVQESGFSAFDAVHTPTNDKDNYSLAYSQFVVPLVKAVQELNAKSEAQQRLIDELLQGKQLNLNSETGSDQRQTQSIVLTGMDNPYLGQNVPNPFNEETSIDYYIPEALFCDNGSCHIIFYDHLGRTIQEMTVLKSGYGKINVSTKNLSSGVITYKLLVNGEIIDVKKMLFNK
jgi:hypothetical protein